MSEIKTRNVRLKPFKVTHRNGLDVGLVLKRDITTKEARHILGNILCVELGSRMDYECTEEYKDYNTELTSDVQNWLTGDMEDSVLMETYASDCGDEPIGAINMILILGYLQRKGII